MSDLLKANEPMPITDRRIREHIAEYFPPNALAYVTKCGGIKDFLLQAFQFATIDDVVCVTEKVVAAQDMVVNRIVEKFKTSKFLIR